MEGEWEEEEGIWLNIIEYIRKISEINFGPSSGKRNKRWKAIIVLDPRVECCLLSMYIPIIKLKLIQLSQAREPVDQLVS